MDGLIAYALSKKYADEVGRSILDAGFKTQVEQDRSILQTTGQEKILYFIPKTTAKPSDGYDEYVYSNNAWEQVGVTDIDLSFYATKAEVGNLNNLPTTDKSSIVSAISETFTSVSNGKSLVASAITDKGVSTSSDATFEIMAQNIEAIPTGSPTVLNPALVLWDWEGTKLAEYSREDALALTELPAPDTLPPYAAVDHELLVFQSWNRSLVNIKTWIQNHDGETCNVDAIYTTTDGQDHNFWNNPRLDTANKISMQKRGTASIGNYAFQSCFSLTQINIPDGVTRIGSYAFSYCYSLTQINIPDSVTSIGSYAFQSCSSLTQINIPDSVTSIGNKAFQSCSSLTQINIPDGVTSIGSYAFQSCSSLTQINIPDGVTSIWDSAFNDCRCLNDIVLESKPMLANTNAFGDLPSNYRIYVPRENLPWFETATNWSMIYAQGHIVAIEDYIDYLESIGFNVDKYKEAA